MAAPTGDEVFTVLKEQVLAVAPDLDPVAVVPGARLADLLADSLDRMDVVVAAVEALGVDAPLRGFGRAADLGELTELLRAGIAS